MKIKSIQTDCYHIPLSQTFTDAVHGQMTSFTVVTVLVRTSDGAEELGYTYTVRSMGGASIQAMIERDLGPFLSGKDPRHIEML